MKSSQQFRKMMSVVYVKYSYIKNSIWFLYKGEKISEVDTPQKLGMKNGDKILVIMKKPN